MKKVISLMLSLSIIASVTTFVQTSAGAAAIPVPQETTLFSDDFEGYSEGFAAVIEGNWGKVAVTDVAGTDIFKFYGHKNTATTAPTGYSGIGDTAKIMQIASATDSGIGEGSSLVVTAQTSDNNMRNQLIKDSGIDSDTISGKRIVFTTKFKVPKFVGFGDGVGVYLTSTTSTMYEPTSNNTNIHLSHDTTDKAGELIYLGSRPAGTYTGGAWAYDHVGNGKHNQLWTFGEKVADLQAGTEYTYTITMTPKSDGGYNVVTDLNGTKLVLGQSTYTTSSTVPTVAEMSEFAAVRVMRLTHPWYFNAGNAKGALVDWLSTGYGSTLGITTSNGLYDIDRPVAYFDDMSLKAVEHMDVIFKEDFESGYTDDIIPGTTGWGKKYTSDYDFDTFNWMCGGTADYLSNDQLSAWIKSTPTPANAALIEANTGVGNGKALKFTGQIGITGYTMAKKSNLESFDIAGKQLEFRTDFKAPISGVMGEGFGVWLDADTSDEQILTVSENTGIIDGTGDLLKGELMYVGSRNNVNGKQTANGARATYLYVFGEQVARLNPDAVYDLKVTLTPTDEGGYTGAVTLNGRNIALTGTLPTQSEMATYNRLYSSPVTHAWRMQTPGAMWSADARPADMVDSNGYIMGRTVGILDNISMIAKGETSAPTTDADVNMTAIDTDWTSKGTSFVNALATVSGTTATVEVRSDRTESVTPVIIAATYDENRKLMNVVMNNTTTVEPFGTETVTLNGLAEDYTTAKAFVWNIGEMNPYTSMVGIANSSLGGES